MRFKDTATIAYTSCGTKAATIAPKIANNVSQGFHASGAQDIGESAEGAQVELFRTNLRIDVESCECSLRARAIDAERERKTVGERLPAVRECGAHDLQEKCAIADGDGRRAAPFQDDDCAIDFWAWIKEVRAERERAPYRRPVVREQRQASILRRRRTRNEPIRHIELHHR